MKKLLALLCSTALSITLCAAAHADETAITIYSRAQPGAVDPSLYRPIPGQQTGYTGLSVPGYAIVRQTREIQLPAAMNSVQFSDVAALLDPTTVQFKSLTSPKNTKVTEQNYQFDLVSQQKLLEKYIDKTITVEKTAGDKTQAVEGTLLSTDGGLTLKNASGGIQSIANYASVSFPDLPGQLITRPTLVWNITTGSPGTHKSEVSYQTQGITWWADYNLIYKEGKEANSGTVDVSSWVSIINQTGAGFKNAKLKLMAGDVQTVASARQIGATRAMMLKEMDAGAAAPAFAEKAFFEYHLYTLDTPVDLPDNSTKQLELIPAVADVPVEKTLVFAGNTHYGYGGGIYIDQGYGSETAKKKVDVFLKLKNKKELGLGVPLPAGRMRVNQRDDDGSLEFIGENTIGHTPRNEEVSIKLGSAFDVVGERKQTDYKLDTARKMADEDITITIRNQKNKPVKVKVVESMYRSAQWQITESSQEPTKDHSSQVSWLLEVPPEKEKTVRYRVHYSW